MIYGFDASVMSLKMCDSLITPSTNSEVIEWLVFSEKQRRPRIFKNDLNCGNQGLSMRS